MMSNSKSEMSTLMEKISLNVKYYKHTFLRICEPCEVFHLSTDRKSTGICRIGVQPFLERIYIISKHTIFKNIFKDFLNNNELLLKKFA